MSARRVRISLFPAVLCVTLLFILPVRTAAAEPTHTIGVILPLTGPLAEVGKSIRNGILLADRTYDLQERVRFIFEDDQFQARNSLSAAWKLIKLERVDGLIVFGGSTSNAVADVAEKQKIPMVAITALAKIGSNRKFVYSLFMSTKGQTAVLSQACTAADFKRIAVITNTQDALLFLREDFVSSNKDRIVFDDEVAPGEVNLRSLVTRVIDAKPDAVLLLVLPPHNAYFSTTLRAQGFTGQFLGGPPASNPTEISASAGALVGTWLPAPVNTSRLDYFSRYEEEFNEPPIIESMYDYDAAHLYIEASESEDIAQFLSRLQIFQGLAGDYPKNPENALEVPVELSKIAEDATLHGR